MVATYPALTLYSARICPWAQRATLALKETGTPHSIYEIDLQNKPQWYNAKINPASKVPVLQIGGENEDTPNVPRIPESAVLLELISDLGPTYGKRTLAPSDPVERAQARYFIERHHQVLTEPFLSLLYRGQLDALPKVLKGAEEIQALLQTRIDEHGGPFWHGKEPGLADIGIAPFVGRLEVYSRTIEPVSETDLHRTLYSDAKYALWAKYTAAIKSRPSWGETFDETYIVDSSRKRIQSMRAAAK